MLQIFAPQSSLRAASRLPALSGEARVSIAEVAILLACGAFAVLAVGILHLPVRMPGHAILRAVLPMALGLALVPRRSAGMGMSIGAGLTAAAMNADHIGRFPPAAVLGILVLGPILDAVLVGNPQGWRLYARFATAGALANLLAFAVRFGIAWLGWDLAGSRQFTEFWLTALPSFFLCGALAGLVSAAVWFRMSPRGYPDDDLRRN